MLAPDAPAAPYAIRPAEAGDVPFLLGCWLEHWKHESHHAHRIRAREFYEPHRQLLVGILGHAQALIACDATDPTSIAGCVVFELGAPVGPILDFLYVKKSYRRMGIGAALLRATGLPADLRGVLLSHAPRAWFSTQRDGPGYEERYPLAVNHPYLAWRYAPPGHPYPQSSGETR